MDKEPKTKTTPLRPLFPILPLHEALQTAKTHHGKGASVSDGTRPSLPAPKKRALRVTCAHCYHGKKQALGPVHAVGWSYAEACAEQEAQKQSKCERANKLKELQGVFVHSVTITCSPLNGLSLLRRARTEACQTRAEEEKEEGREAAKEEEEAAEAERQEIRGTARAGHERP